MSDIGQKMKIAPDDAFDADSFDKPVIGIASEMGVHDSGRHSHLRHQLLYSAAGSITIELEQALCLLPPRRAVWIPAGTVHRAIMRGVMAYRSLYFSTTLPLSELPLQIVDVNPLFFEVIERMAFWPWEMPAAQQASTGSIRESSGTCPWRSRRDAVKSARKYRTPVRSPQKKRRVRSALPQSSPPAKQEMA